MGSCFAVNIGRYLYESGYNYLVYEPMPKNRDPKGLNPYLAASANWNLVYNSACIRQIFEYSLGKFETSLRWWDDPRSKARVVDPYRRNTIYNKKDCAARFESHVYASKSALTDSDIVILTVGLSEVWRNRKERVTYWRKPYNLRDGDEFHRQSVCEIYKDLLKCYLLIKEVNPKVKIIITVSPVPFNLSYRNDVDVISANEVSKAKIRLAVDLFAELEDVFYFPAYEMVRIMVDPYVEDGRHVKPSAIVKVMRIFERRFSK
jgi:hypothetical protein